MLFRLTATGPASVALRTVEEGSEGLFPHDLTTAVSNAHVPKPRPPAALCHPHCELGTPASWCQLLPLPACLRWPSALLWPVAQEPFGPRHPRALIRQESTDLLSAMFNVTQMWTHCRSFCFTNFQLFAFHQCCLLFTECNLRQQNRL